MSRSEKLAGQVLDALVRSVDRHELAAALERVMPDGGPESGGSGRTGSGRSGSGQSAKEPSAKIASAVLDKIVLSDILDDSILGARPGETSFPLRMLFGTLGDELEDDTAFALANGLNFYFRVGMDEEAKVRVGLEVSRLYYRFADERPLDADLTPQLSPLLARLMSTELTNLTFEAVDSARVFDSSVHERELGSDGSSSRIAGPKSFLCRVVSNGRVRAKASVKT